MRFQRGDRTPTGLFGTRDASWYAHPDVGSTKQFHAIALDGLAVCSAAIVIDETTLLAADRLRESRICRRRPCLNAWRASSPASPEEVPNGE